MKVKKITVCPHCGRTGLAGNFCSECAGKLVKECDCWVLHTKFNCGLEKCPGYKLLVLLLKAITVDQKLMESKVTGSSARQIADMPELMKIECFADPELRLAEKVNEKPEPRRWYWKIKYFVEDYFMLFLSCTCLVFAYLILTR